LLQLHFYAIGVLPLEGLLQETRLLFVAHHGLGGFVVVRSVDLLLVLEQ
jgi:hypothetical protein